MQPSEMRADVKGRRPASNAVSLPIRETHTACQFVRLSDLRELAECGQVAAVCYRMRGGKIEFLLVRTRGSRRWTFPKGSAEPGLTSAQAAALEAFEEAGVHGRIEQTSFARYVSRKCGKMKHKVPTEETVANAHLCEVLHLAKPKEWGRDRTWFSAQEAKRRLRKGRESTAAAEFIRVVEKAVLRIESLPKKRELPRGRTDATAVSRLFQAGLPRQPYFATDPLRRVQFEASPQLHGGSTRLPLLPRGVQRSETTESPPPPIPTHSRKLLLGDVLPFNSKPAANLRSALQARRQKSAKNNKRKMFDDG